MTIFYTLLLLPLAAVVAAAGFDRDMTVDTGEDVRSFTVDTAHSTIGFKVRHLGITNVSGRFGSFDASVRVDPSDPSTLEASATVQVASIDTGIDRRDAHLRSADFFDAETHPTLTFASREVRNVDGDRFELVGDLTIRGTTREVVLDGRLVGTATMGESRRIAFEASTDIDRFDYGLQWNQLTEMGGLVVSDTVHIVLEIQAIEN